MKFPITPQYIREAPDEISKLYIQLETWILQDICNRFRMNGATATALEHIRNMQRRGYSYRDIQNVVKRVLKLSDAEYNRIMRKAIDDNRKYYSDLWQGSGLVTDVFNDDAMRREVWTIIAQCKGELDNITQSLGFCIRMNGQITYLPIAAAYRQALNFAEVKILSGAQSYEEAIRESVQQLAESGIQTVSYDKDGKQHVDHADVAARRAIMTGITQISGKYSERIAQDIPTPYFEVTAHSGARDKDRQGIPWANHKRWQGKVYSIHTADKYPNIYSVTGLGQVDGLEGANCRHLHFPFWDGISERTYTDAELANIDPAPFNYGGKSWSAYDATQRQRLLERSLRKTKRKLIAFKASGNANAYKSEAARYRAITQEYEAFCKAGKLRPTERGNIPQFGASDGRDALKALNN